jgi:lipopolysaccharide/colanic/teichoic acid biosynthesis glycosyltransferase
MHTGIGSSTIALNTAVHDSVVIGERHETAGLRDDSWIHAALRKPWQFALKRAFDATVSGTALLLLAPFFAIIAAAIVLENRGPVFFSQLRWGRGGKLIRVYKFRSMRTELCDVSGIKQTRAGDPRITRTGAFLRRTNLDELPQLINILIGDMSFVGPRCHVPGMLAAGRPYEELVDEYHIRHLVRPGLTGLAQVNGLRGPTDCEELARARIAKDIEYIRTFSFLGDIKIFFNTLRNEFKGGTGF